jgi:hypothetical protein
MTKFICLLKYCSEWEFKGDVREIVQLTYNSLPTILCYVVRCFALVMSMAPKT